jgi:hypothetical protein
MGEPAKVSRNTEPKSTDDEAAESVAVLAATDTETDADVVPAGPTAESE